MNVLNSYMNSIVKKSHSSSIAISVTWYLVELMLKIVDHICSYVSYSYLIQFIWIKKHDNTRLLLLDHLPKISNGWFYRALSTNVSFTVIVSLYSWYKHGNYWWSTIYIYEMSIDVISLCDIFWWFDQHQ